MVEKGKGRILVTGAGGFIGSHVAERLHHAGYQVRAMVQYQSRGSAGWLENSESALAKEMEIIRGDVRDPLFMEVACKGVRAAVHLAALISIPYSYVAARSFIDTNVLGTVNLLEAGRKEGLAKIVVASTSEVYGTPSTVPITESHPLRPQSPYAASKVAADAFAFAYARTYEQNVAVLRPFNTYGPRQSLRAVIPTVLAQMLAGSEQIQLGALETRRDFTYVTDTAKAFQLALEAPGEWDEVVQLGTGKSVEISELVQLCAEVTNWNGEIVTTGERLRPMMSEVQVLESLPKEAEQRLGWTADVPLVAGIRWTAEWLAAQLDNIEVGRHHI